MQTVTPAELGFDTDRLTRINAWMDRYVEQGLYAGSSVLVARGGREVHSYAAGLRDVENGAVFARDTVARIYSMTKPITSVGLMMLVERGLVNLNAPVCDFLPEFSNPMALIQGAERIDQVEPSRAPTLHELLTHTSGMSYSFNPGVLSAHMGEIKADFWPNQPDLQSCVAKLAKLPLAFQPGARWEYSVGIDIIGRVIEVVSGKTLDVFFADEILGPLGMSETAFRVRPDQGSRFAACYTPLSGEAFALGAKEDGAPQLNLSDDAENSPFLTTTNFSGGGRSVRHD